MKPILFSAEVSKQIIGVERRDRKLYKLIAKKLVIFQNNPRHPSLRLHKLQGKLGQCWSISVNRSVRLVYEEHEDKCVFIDLGTHDEVYKK